MENIKKICLFLATAGWLGALPFGSIFASFLAIPLLGLLNLCFYFSPLICWWLTLISAGLVLFSLFVAIHMTTTVELNDIAADKVMGLMLSLAGLKLTVRTVVVGIMGFHLARLYLPYFYRKLPIPLIGSTDHFIGLVFASGTAGVIINLAIRFMLWTAG